MTNDLPAPVGGGRNLGEALAQIQRLSIEAQAEIGDGRPGSYVMDRLVEIAIIASDMNPSVPTGG